MIYKLKKKKIPTQVKVSEIYTELYSKKWICATGQL